MKSFWLLLPLVIGCKKAEHERVHLPITVEIVRETETGYTIQWRDTLGKAGGFNTIERPLELHCTILGSKNDTLGYYRGLSMAQDYAYFETEDTVAMAHFRIAPNFFAPVYYETPNGRDLFEKNKKPIDFEPVVLHFRKHELQRQELMLVEKLPNPANPQLP